MSGPAPGQGREVVLMFPGQGAQHTRMAAGLYGREPVFTTAMDEAFEAFGEHGPALRADWLAVDPEVPIDHVCRAQPLLFAVDHALGRLVLSWGVRPVALIGHSVGEVAAATLAGVFSLPDAARMMADRVASLAGAADGAMFAVAATTTEVEPYLVGEVVIGGINAPRQVVLAGPASDLGSVVEKLRLNGFTGRPVPSTTGFHSPMLASLAGRARPLIETLGLHPPSIPVHSAYTAAVLTDETALDPGFWAGQPAAPVLFWPALDTLLADRQLLLVDVGPGQGLAALARRHPAVRSGRSAVAGLLPARPGDPELDVTTTRAAIPVVTGLSPA
jgi:acyl transferase domain-containing protein